MAVHFDDLTQITCAPDLLAALEQASHRLSVQQKNIRDNFDAMCAMRNDINQHIPMPSLESDLLQGPEASVFCEAVARSVIAALEQVQARAVAAEAEAERLRGALVAHNDLLRSAFQIAEREGVKQMVATTNWDAFYNRVTVVLKRHHETANAARVALGDAP